ncbi:MAG: DUF927 domain-containing protein [Rhizobiales bacterium]|nr:DUF927 domain-containing protein [Hyphomicrobiales bacterium]
MDTIEFLRRILPVQGLYVAARLINGKFKNQVCDSIEELAQQVHAYDAAGVHAYMAVAAYRERSVDTVKPDGSVWHQVRTHKNVRALRSFFMDLDVDAGNPKKFASQEEACEQLLLFCAATHLPMPMVLSSGGGVHIYWSLENHIQPEAWKQTAESLKALCAHHKFRADPACTSDLARVLRPVGTHNRKVPTAPRPVELIADAVPVAFAVFQRCVADALAAVGVKPPEGPRQVEARTETLNQAFAVKNSFPPCSGTKVADRCAQVRVVRDNAAGLTEPQFYTAVQLLVNSIEGDELIHQWASKNPHYNRASGFVDKKIAQIREQSIGPPLCTTFESRNPGGCDGCAFRGKISSPAQLGTQVASAPAPVIQVKIANVTTAVTLPAPPEGFTRGEPKTAGKFDGGIYVEQDGVTHLIYEFDCFPVELAYDEQLGYETMRWRHWLPNEGWKECVMRSSLLAKPAEFEVSLRDNHIQPLIKGKFNMYGDAYIRRLKSQTKLRQLFKCQGWKRDDTEFVLGDKLYKRGEVVQAGFSHGMEAFLKPFHSRGDLAVWRTLTEVFDTPGFEPHAFMLLLAFAAPLLKLANWQGCTVNALGESGVGKSTMAEFMCSVYGSPKGSWVGRNDTDLARMQRLGAHYNLPVYMDEATTIKPEPLRDLVYSIPTGKNRSSMRADYTLRPGAEWVTLLVMSTNNSLQSKLLLENQNAEAESLRLFEFRFPRVDAFGPIADIVPNVLREHYGVAGPAYIQHLVENRDRIRARLAEVGAEEKEEFDMAGKERFWTWVTSLVLYGGELAREAGVIDFDPGRIRPWLMRELNRMRGTMDDNKVGPVSILANFLDEHVGERLVVNTMNAGLAAVQDKPYHEISQRYEPAIKTLWISRKRIKFYLDKKHFGFADIEAELIRSGVILHPRAGKTLGAGTNYASGPTTCWVVNMEHAEMSGVVV